MSDDAKSLPIVGVDYGYLWGKAAVAQEGERERREGEEERVGVDASSPILCGRNSHDGWLTAQLCQQKGDNERNRIGLSQELLAGGYPRIIVRSDGEPSIQAHIR